MEKLSKLLEELDRMARAAETAEHFDEYSAQYREGYATGLQDAIELIRLEGI